MLTTENHDRDLEGYKYVYPVISRRAGGLSVGINLNTNNACNWRCIYCQVPNLVRGAPPPVSLPDLNFELRSFLQKVLVGNYLREEVPEGMRRLNDIALSGNGEPTSSPNFSDVVELVAQTRSDLSVDASVKTVLITNGSLIHQKDVRLGIGQLKTITGEVWFKVDSVTKEGVARINDSPFSLSKTSSNLEAVASLCDTWVQTCVFDFDGLPPSEHEQNSYLKFLRDVALNAKVRGVLLYGVARKSYQPEAPRISRLNLSWLESFSKKILELGLAVKISH
jgi:wyosine [tRNA(Phe)-imidazoG37] synthetase (radical SAM superfamily)